MNMLKDTLEALEGRASGTRPDTHAAQLGTAASSSQVQQQRLLGLPPPSEQISQLRKLLPPAARLAALMQQYYALLAVEAERQLALARAAAGRSCAYLHCANLGGEGGPAAGQGVGSMRCRWVGVSEMV